MLQIFTTDPDGDGFTTQPPPPPEGPQGPALLSGGAGNDTLVSGAADSVVGGQGDDLAILKLATFFSSPPADPAAFARDAWDGRASGIEDFDVIQKP
jgi:Ca2+-binding RTX toxin-like protein